MDDYKIIKVLKDGKIISTCLGEDKNGKKVIIKSLNMKNVDDWKTVQLFEREGEIFRTLSHPRIPGYRNVVQEELEDTTIYNLVYEYIEGKSLQELLDEGEVFPYSRVQNIMVQVLEILNYIHTFEPTVIHRDISPKNIILNGEEIYLVDFGAGKLVQTQQAKKSGETYVGTYGYMPFEQMVGDAVTQSDLYALGMTAIHLLTGRQPSLFEMKQMKPDYKTSGTKTLTDRLIDRMIEPDPGQRIKSALDCFDFLNGKTENRQVSTRRIKTWSTGDAEFLLCKRLKAEREASDIALGFWHDHPFLSIIGLTIVTAGVFFVPLFFIRFNKRHKRWLNKKVESKNEVSMLVDSHAVQVPGQMHAISKKRIRAVDFIKHENSNGTINLEVEFFSRGNAINSCYFAALTEQDVTEIEEFVKENIISE